MGATGAAHAACNIIPSAQRTFRSRLGSLDRPFAGPGDVVRLDLDDPCHAAAASFDGDAGDFVVTLVFTPVGSGSPTVVALAADCSAVTAACAGIGPVECREVVVAGPAAGLQKAGPRALRFRFPDTDASLPPAGDGIGLTGPVRVAVTRLGEQLPCGLATSPCAAQAGVVACVDALLRKDGSCGSDADATFPTFTALPPPNDYQAFCSTPSPPCTSASDVVRLAVDGAGNLLLPIDWRGILVDRDAVPVARLLRGSTPVPAFPGAAGPIRIPDVRALTSFSPEGARLPPLFDPQRDPTAEDAATLFGSADAPATVLRIARHIEGQTACAGGTADGLACGSAQECPGGDCAAARCVGGPTAGGSCVRDADCSGGECGPSLFDFTTRIAGGVGPVVLQDFRAAALDPVPLDGLNQSTELNAFVLEESITNQDLNGDGDATDHVVQVGDRITGAQPAVGEGGRRGLAIARVRMPPFSFPALAVDGDVLAFLEPEFAQFGRDGNGDGDTADTLLRIVRLGGGTPVTQTFDVAVDAAPRIDGRSIAVSHDRVFFRASETGNARTRTTRIATVGACTPDLPAGFGATVLRANGVSMSDDGKVVAYEGRDVDPGTGDHRGPCQIFAYDRTTGLTTRITSTTTFGDSTDPKVSGDGRVVVFTSRSAALVPGDTNQVSDVFAYDRATGDLARVSVATDGEEARGESRFTAVSGDGRFVAFTSYAANLVAGDTNDCANDVNFPAASCADVFVHDRETGITELVSVAPNGAPGSTTSGQPTISADGRYVAFSTLAQELAPGYGGEALASIVVRDRLLGTTERASTATDGTDGNSFSFSPVISPDGRWVAFASLANNLVAGDVFGEIDTFLRDRLRGTTVRASLRSDGSGLPNATTFSAAPPVVSRDGRMVGFENDLDLTPGGSASTDVFLHDVATGITSLVDAGLARFGRSHSIAISGDATVAAFRTGPTTEPEPVEFVFVRAPDTTDPGSDLDGDGTSDGSILEVFDASLGTRTMLCSATDVAVAGGAAAFLRPEAIAGTPRCPGGSLNAADTDVADAVVHLWRGGARAENLGRAAVAIALSADTLAALVAEDMEGGHDLDGDGDAADDVVEVHPVGFGDWTNVGQAADRLAVAGPAVVFTTPEAATGVDLNGDGDPFDRVVQLYDARTGGLVNIGAPAEDFVVGASGLIAFRTAESAQNAPQTGPPHPPSGTDLNGDGDTRDTVLQVYDPATGMLLNTHQAVTPCNLEACDPRTPYRVLDHTVTFLTLESDQGRDLNGDGDLQDLVLQMVNVSQACHTGTMEGACHTLAATSAGICTSTGGGCVRDADCAGGTCFLPPGGCVRDVGPLCDPRVSGGCPDGTLCAPIAGAGGAGSCRQVEGPCAGPDDCAFGAVCNDGGQTFQRVVNPLVPRDGGSLVFAGSGHCLERTATSCAGSADCAAGEFCDDGACTRDRGVCSADADCVPPAVCRQDLLAQTVADSDGDEVPDAVDVCPEVADPMQEDVDGDGVGDACDVTTSCERALDVASVRCRIAALADVAARLMPPGRFRDATLRPLAIARDVLAAAGGVPRSTDRALRRADRRLAFFVRRIRSLRGRRLLDAATRTQLLDLVAPLRADVAAMRDRGSR